MAVEISNTSNQVVYELIAQVVPVRKDGVVGPRAKELNAEYGKPLGPIPPGRRSFWLPYPGERAQLGGPSRFVRQHTRRLSSNDSDFRFDGDAAGACPAHLAPGCAAENLLKLESRWDARPVGVDRFAPRPALAVDMPHDNPLRPAQADLLEVQIGVLGADMVEDAGDGAANLRVESLR